MFSKEQIQQAKDANLVELLLDLNYPLKKVTNREYSLIAHDSCKISPTNGFYWHSRDVGGNAIDFFMIVENMTFTQAVSQILSRSARTNVNTISKQAKPNTKKQFKLPPANWNNTKVIDYLTSVRKIDKSLVMHCIHSKLLYESAHTHNAIFLGYDRQGIARHAFQRGTSEKRFAGDVEGSDKHYGFTFRFLANNESHTLYLFETPIDMLSYISLQKLKGGKCPHTYLSLSGISLFGFTRYIEESNVESVFVATDNDVAGHRVYDRIQSYCMENALSIAVSPAFPVRKDYNEDLIAFTTAGLSKQLK